MGNEFFISAAFVQNTVPFFGVTSISQYDLSDHKVLADSERDNNVIIWRRVGLRIRFGRTIGFISGMAVGMPIAGKNALSVK